MPKEPDKSENKRFIGVWMDKELADRLAAKAQRQDRSVSAEIRRLLREDLGL